MNVNANDLLIGSLLDKSELKIRSQKTDEKIRANFGKKEPLGVSLKISHEAKEKAQSDTAVHTRAVSRQTALPEGHAPEVKRDLVRTGYASIDNTIIDSLNGVSDEIRQYAYDIVRNDLLLTDVSGISEEERQELISLGMTEAQFVADNYLSGENAEDYMTAMRRVAGIAANGVRDEDGIMDYGGLYETNITENGYTVEITDTFRMMKQYRPEMYAQSKALEKEIANAKEEDKIPLLSKYAKLNLDFMKDMIREQPEAFKQFEREQMRKLEELPEFEVSDTFRDAETKGVKNFMNALMQIQMKNQQAFSAFPALTKRIHSILSQFYAQ